MRAFGPPPVMNMSFDEFCKKHNIPIDFADVGKFDIIWGPEELILESTPKGKKGFYYDG